MNKILLTSAALALILFGACSGADKSEKDSKQDTAPVVKTMQVNDREVNQIGNYTATVEPELINNISSSAPNRIKQILVDEGMRVSAGQRLVVMDDINTTSYRLQLDNAKANLRNIEVDYNRALELYKIGGGTKQQVDQMETQLVNAKNAVASAERTLRNMNENTVLTSPISGVVTARNYDPGDMTGSLPILTVARTQPVKIIVNVSESELSKVRRGMPAIVTFDTYGNEIFNGTVTLVSPTVDHASRTFGVEVTLSNSDNRILPGMFGRVELSLGTARRVVVPDKAVVKQPGSGNHYVYVYNADGTVSYNKVELGQRLGDSYELISGVEPGSTVVVSGQSRLANGMKVKVTK
ncbi:efflux RND transporter periplasmic adaptor subunit [Barnesiella sp. CU968]|jgi:RND family efflux transporter MFP subunit|uniref:efflux RND transporter periplasmic adaptor subunit n=1 Tax=Barnesiella sp. CU968 TaxID=2780099 RepID=UPI000F51A59F|nr:efflux RND transporter periplasmic adaptor subunit [Barnesiella sp. CU968]MBJ2192913.1 efflux RND transporter periplasmic adaptor subunit [Muribaculaceae bacterium]ROS81753.1 efflux RND transporter periplasmic adaptor subunit [Muribaculaceae bacterium Isolate-036 (Harlan)]RXE68225.1 efflux RND transporter periplasmic adaptor subunit [Muribaculaceae bacterium Isolate-001 (NCI)]MBJ2197507.1 efflux RND transporter periplasmic adaptor subunit [Muribaculaceae bacterium]MCI9030506.1 efflux RND tr